MVTGKKREVFPMPEELYAKTDGGYDIFRYYLRTVGRVMDRPWGKKEKHPSWGIFKRDGIWYFKDQAQEESGTAVQFVQKYFNLNYGEAMDKIKWDFGLGGGVSTNASPVKITWNKPDEEEEYAQIDVITQPFKTKHHSFWNIAEVTEDHCKSMNCFAVKKLAINKRYVPLPPGEVVFAYYAPEVYSWKIYFPERSKGKKFRNNVPGDYLWNMANVDECDDLIVQKSNKDLIVTTMLTPCVTSTMNESAGIFDEKMVKALNEKAKRIWIWYGSDDDGVQKCKKITGANKWKYINTPKFLLPDVNDTYSFVKMHNITRMGTGLQELEKFMKSKKLLK